MSAMECHSCYVVWSSFPFQSPPSYAGTQPFFKMKMMINFGLKNSAGNPGVKCSYEWAWNFQLFWMSRNIEQVPTFIHFLERFLSSNRLTRSHSANDISHAHETELFLPFLWTLRFAHLTVFILASNIVQYCKLRFHFNFHYFSIYDSVAAFIKRTTLWDIAFEKCLWRLSYWNNFYKILFEHASKQSIGRFLLKFNQVWCNGKKDIVRTKIEGELSTWESFSKKKRVFFRICE